MKLSILIPTIKRDEYPFKALMESLYVQSSEAREMDGYWSGVDVLADFSESDNIGRKRNSLLNRATGEYCCFIDSDDNISDNYIELLMQGINKGVDCCSLMGEYHIDDVYDGLFDHSLKYSEWKTNFNGIKPGKIKYERYPNHLNCIKSSIAKQFKFPETNWGEDHDWSKEIHESGLIKTEHYIDQVIYYYKKVTKK